jgi:hypothetical protein
VRDMPTRCESVRFRGKAGSRRLAVKVTRLTHTGHLPGRPRLVVFRPFYSSRCFRKRARRALWLAFPVRIVLREHVFEVIPAFPFG